MCCRWLSKSDKKACSTRFRGWLHLLRPASLHHAIAAAQEKRAGGLPASIQNVALDELQRMFVDSLKKLKARDKRIADLAEAQKAVAAENAALREQVAARPSKPNGADSRLQVPGPVPVCLVCVLPWLERLGSTWLSACLCALFACERRVFAVASAGPACWRAGSTKFGCSASPRQSLHHLPE